MKKLAFKHLRTSIFSVLRFIIYEYQLENSNRGWENPYQVYSERYRNEDAHLLEDILNDRNIYERFTNRFTMEEVGQRIEDGHILYVAKKGGKIIGYCWYLVDKVKIPVFDATLYLKPDEVCSANVYVQPGFRRKGIRTYVRVSEHNELIQKGYKRSLAYVLEDNKAALRMHQKFGSIQIGEVKRIIILTFTYYYTNLKTNKIVLQSEPLLLWKKLYNLITN